MSQLADTVPTPGADRAPMRVLHVVGSLGRGGAEAFILGAYRALDRSRLQFDFVANRHPAPYPHEEEIRDLNGRVFFLPRFRGWNLLQYRQAWRRFLREHPEWGVIHFHHTSSALFVLDILRREGRKSIAHSHTVRTGRSLRGSLKAVTRWPLRFSADALVACSREAADSMFGSRSAKTQVVPNAVDARAFRYNEARRAEVRRKLGIEHGLVVGHVGRFVAEKNHERLLDIFQQLVHTTPTSRLLLSGDGPLRNAIMKRVETLGLSESVTFLGLRDDIPDLMQAMDVFLLPSLAEGLPVVLVEAQASGLPCIVSDAVTREVDLTGLVDFVSLRAADDIWARHLLAAQGQDRSTAWQAVTEAGYDTGRSAEMLESLYTSLIHDE